ncbi:hypothetical protein VNO80_06553 [Phaseolus coccineus]|uniref:Transmembrane protein n=1 Tax=Phaseolus coccineus TaxID=3886 RepID=A0AAN9NH20_PHACN
MSNRNTCYHDRPIRKATEAENSRNPCSHIFRRSLLCVSGILVRYRHRPFCHRFIAISVTVVVLVTVDFLGFSLESWCFFFFDSVPF